MKICLKNPKSKLLLKAENQWTDSPEEALGFTDTADAVRYSLQNSLWRMRVVLFFNDGSQFTRSVVPNRWEAGVILRFERIVAASKRCFVGALAPSRPKHNPFAFRIP